MKMLKDFISFITGLAAIIFVMIGIYYANKSTPNYDESSYCLLIGIINYLTCINFSKND